MTKIELSDFTESAVLETEFSPSSDTCNGNSCNSCGGGCYGCKSPDFYLNKRGLKENSEELQYEIRNNS